MIVPSERTIAIAKLPSNSRSIMPPRFPLAGAEMAAEPVLMATQPNGNSSTSSQARKLIPGVALFHQLQHKTLPVIQVFDGLWQILWKTGRCGLRVTGARLGAYKQ
jgi:hypothetical protein